MSDKILTFFHYIQIFLDVPVSRLYNYIYAEFIRATKPEIICKKKKTLPKKIKHWSSSTDILALKKLEQI